MSSFTRADYLAVFNFARSQYFWHEATGRNFDMQAAIIMERCEEVIGQQSSFPREARARLAETPKSILRRTYKKLCHE
jgi:hypothetical protein